MSDVDQQSVLALTIQDKSVLYGAYMSFLQNGGLFVPTARHIVWEMRFSYCSL
jgi:Tfp pilus assembly protein PilZ